MKDVSGIKPRTPKQIARAGLTLSMGFIALPFIPFKDARNYQPFKKKLNK